MQTVPTEVLDHILCYAAGSITALSLVCSTWRHTVANSDELPAIIVARSHPDIFRVVPALSSWAAVHNRVVRAKQLAPLPPALLTDIENCDRVTECPCYVEALTSDDVDHVRMHRCLTCQRRVRALRGEAADWPFYSVKFRTINSNSRRTTYDAAVLDTDGVSAHALLRAIRWISLSKSAVEGFVEVDATTLTTRPDLRYTGGSCAHQYRLVPHTITADRAALHDELEWARMRTELGVLFVVCANQFSGSEVPLGSMRLNQFCLSEQAVEGESIAEFAKRVTDFFESWCGSESDECTDDESD